MDNLVSGISSWASQIIIAVVISLIFEMILPDSKNKKYVKMVIGVYILFTILSPIISKSSINIEKDIKFSEYSENKETQKNADKLTNTSLKEAYILSLKQDIHSKLREKGYVVSTIKIDAEMEKDNYGKINSLEIGISKKSEDNRNETSISIDKVNIGNTIDSKKDNSNITEDEYNELKVFISNEYGVDLSNIKLT